MLGKLSVPGRPTNTVIRIIVAQGHIVLSAGASGGCLDVFYLVYHPSVTLHATSNHVQSNAQLVLKLHVLKCKCNFGSSQMHM